MESSARPIVTGASPRLIVVPASAPATTTSLRGALRELGFLTCFFGLRPDDARLGTAGQVGSHDAERDDDEDPQQGNETRPQQEEREL